MNQQVSTFKHTHEPVGRIHLSTQYCPKNSFSSLTLDLLAWWGSWVLSVWTINKTREGCSKNKARLFYSLPRIDFPTFFHILICWKWVSMYMSHSVGREICKAMKTKRWDIGSFSDTAHHTILVLYKDYVLQTDSF